MLQKLLRNLYPVIIAVTGLTAFTSSSMAAVVEPDYEPSRPLATTPWYEQYSHENHMVDQHFITGMRPHHQGALSMAQEYLAAETRASARLQHLARAIIANQKFEILMLDTVESLINEHDYAAAPQPQRRQVALNGLAQREKFSRYPIPALWGQEQGVSAEDVRFAKAMIIHHEGALEMCRDYLADAAVNNGYVQRMCLDVLRDQAQEIALMHDIIADYEGNADAIKIDPSMVHGMEGMMHGGGHAGH